MKRIGMLSAAALVAAVVAGGGAAATPKLTASVSDPVNISLKMGSAGYCAAQTRRTLSVVLEPLRCNSVEEKQAMLPAGTITGSPASWPK